MQSFDFKELTIDDKGILNKYFSAYGEPHCDCSFAANFCSNHIYHYNWLIANDFLCQKYISDDQKPEYAFPLGAGDPLPIIRQLEEDARSKGEAFILAGIPEKAVETMRAHYPDWGFAPDRRYADYLYRASDLRDLKGKKYQQKRNHINKFESLYEYRCVDLTEDLFPDCLKLEGKWLSEKCIQGEGIPKAELEEELTDEQIVIRTALKNFKALDFTGCALYAEGEMVAFTLGSAINDSTFCTHIEKADISYEGAYSMINHLMALRLPAHFTYIDREWDAGIEGLRKAKMSYHPAFLSKKIVGRQLTETEKEIRFLWLECFPEDSVADADEFILTKFDPARMLCHKENGVIVSMLHIIPFGRTAYLFAIATSQQYRGQGFASGLINEAIAKCRADGFEKIALIPSDEELRHWYESFGFFGSVRMNFDPMDDFCYGTGTPEKDLAMEMGLCPMRN